MRQRGALGRSPSAERPVPSPEPGPTKSATPWRLLFTAVAATLLGGAATAALLGGLPSAAPRLTNGSGDLGLDEPPGSARIGGVRHALRESPGMVQPASVVEQRAELR